MTLQLILVFAFGVVFVSALLVLAVAIPNPTQQQMFIFRVVLSLAGAGVAALIPGLLDIKADLTNSIVITAGGAIAVFVLLFLVNPPALVKKQ